MQNYKIKFRKLVHLDIKSYTKFYYDKSFDLNLSEQIAKNIYNCIDELCKYAKLYRVIKKVGNYEIRRAICGDFVIPYIINEKTMIVTVLRVFHGKMNYIKSV